MQKTATKIYEELAQLALPHIRHYQTDLTKHDRRQIVEENYTGAFVFGYRDNGTDILLLKPTLEALLPKGWLQAQSDTKDQIREELRKIYKDLLPGLTYLNEAFLYFDGYHFHHCSKKEVSARYLNHIDTVCNQW